MFLLTALGAWLLISVFNLSFNQSLIAGAICGVISGVIKIWKKETKPKVDS